jgi:hypothetical protein
MGKTKEQDMNIFKWFKSPTNYPQQVLTDNQLEILNFIDQSLVDMHKDKKITGELCVKSTVVPYMATLLPAGNIMSRISLKNGEFYMPRSVALVVDSDGNWQFMYGLRCEKGSDAITTTLFLECLNRTNNARI